MKINVSLIIYSYFWYYSSDNYEHQKQTNKKFVALKILKIIRCCTKENENLNVIH